jgi:hypothetical protein
LEEPQLLGHRLLPPLPLALFWQLVTRTRMLLVMMMTL